jgi:HPt (histidine-containing phosphotransfer) domain-containing protein
VSEPALARDIFERLREATANQPDVLAELCRDYVSEARKTLEQIRTALAEDNTGQLRERAHYLKGGSMMIGARELSGCCARLEKMGRDGDLSGAAPELEQATAALKTVEAELLRELGPMALPGQGSAA